MFILYILLYTVDVRYIHSHIYSIYTLTFKKEGALLIRVENVSKKLGAFKLSGINMELPKGYICGLIGENGAGKTTLINLLLGLYQPDEGNIYINGNDITTEEVLTKNDIGYVLSDELFDAHLSLLGNANAYGKYYKEYNKDTFLNYCKRFNLEPDRKLKHHSKGEKLKFQFAFALAHNPKLLILDEPTANFDPKFREEFIKVLTEFIEDSERSILLATHLTSDLDRIGDYITFIRKGKIVLSTDRETLMNSYRIVSGENYKLNLIDKKKIIYKEANDYSAKALVKHTRHTEYDKEVTVNIPTIEELMYFIAKGDYHV